MNKKHHKKNKKSGHKPIIIKTPAQIEAIRHAGQILTTLLEHISLLSLPGVSLLDLEAHAATFLKQHNVKGAFKGYNGFPANLCLSVNDCLVHGIPDRYRLVAGDVLKIDAGVTYQGGIADAAVTVIIGGELANTDGQLLIDATKDALDAGLETIKPGGLISDYAKKVHQVIKSRGFSVIELLTGHGVGVEVHEGPYIYNIDHPDLRGLTRKPGMVVALEPITALISREYIEQEGNARNLYTQHGDMGAQREYTVAITQDGVEVLAGVR